MKRIIEAIRLNVLNKAQTVTELYNLEEDPSETTDLVAKFPEKVKELELLMDKEHTESQEFSFCSGIK